jgi:hypothetical protein
VLVVGAGRQKDGVLAVPGRDREVQDVAIERQGTVQVGHRQVDVADARAGVDGHLTL